MTFSEVLKHLRIQNNVHQKECAAHLGISIRAYQRYEEGSREPGLAAIVSIADFFGVSIDYLTGRSNEPRPVNLREKKLTLFVSDGGVILFSERLKALRNKAGIAQADMNNLIGIPQSSYANYENGHRAVPDDVKIRIADFFGVSIDYLLGRSDDPRSEEFSKTRRTFLKAQETELLETLPESLRPAYNEAKEKNPESLQQIIDTFARMAKDYYSLTK